MFIWDSKWFSSNFLLRKNGHETQYDFEFHLNSGSEENYNVVSDAGENQFAGDYHSNSYKIIQKHVLVATIIEFRRLAVCIPLNC